MKRPRTITNSKAPDIELPQTTQDYDAYSNTHSTPKALKFLSCVLSQTEIDIITRIVSLSSKYKDKGGCNLSNSILAERHFCSLPVVSNAISKANRLGLIEKREDEIEKYTNDMGQTFISQNRKLVMKIPPLWEKFGELWAEFYYKGDKECEEVLNWARNKLSALMTNRTKEKENQNRWKEEFLSEIYKSTFRGYFENLMTPPLKLKGPHFKDFMLFNLPVLTLRYKPLDYSSPATDEFQTLPPNNGRNPFHREEGKPSPIEDRKIQVSQFEEFRNLYPSKKGSLGKALTKWNALCHSKQGVPTWGQITSSLESQIQSKRWKDGFIPYLETWLNQRRWLDDVSQWEDISKYRNNNGNGTTNPMKVVATDRMKQSIEERMSKPGKRIKMDDKENGNGK